MIGLTLSSIQWEPSPKKTVTGVLTTACEGFRNKDVVHADFYDDMVTAYSGPDVSGLTLPYGVPEKDFKFAHEIGKLHLWQASLSPLSKKYGEYQVNEDEKQNWHKSILNYELPVSVIGPDFQSTSNDIF